MSNLKELKAAMPKEFAEDFQEQANAYGMTTRQLAAYCISMGFNIFKKACDLHPLPSEPSPFTAGHSGKDGGVNGCRRQRSEAELAIDTESHL